MKYACLVYHERAKLESVPDDDLAKLVGACGAWVADLEKRGQHVFSSGLQSTRTSATVRTAGGELSVTDGPFAETKEFLGGLTILEARDLNEAIHLASKFPAARIGTVEVRPLFDPSAEMTDSLDRKIADAIRRSSKETIAH